MKSVIICACLALAVAQSPSPLPAPVGPFPGQPGPFPGQPGAFPRFGSPQPFAGFPHAPLPYQPHPVPKPVSPIPLPAPLPAPKHVPIQPQPIGIVSQHYHPHHHAEHIPIVRQHQDAQPSGAYQWDFQSANGITQYENAEIVPLGPEQASKTVTGGYSYTSLEGIPVEVTYTADEHGFHPHVVVHLHGEHKH